MKTDAAVWAVFSVLAEKMQQSKDVLSAQNVGNVLYCAFPTFCALSTSLLCPIFGAISDTHTARNLRHVAADARSLYGLRGISSDVPEERALRAVLSELVPKMGQTKLASTERV